MKVIGVLSQKGGAGKTTLAMNLGIKFVESGKITLIIDVDPQGSATNWFDRRESEEPEVIESFPNRLKNKVHHAEKMGCEVVIVDTPGSADLFSSKAAEVSDIVLIPCGLSAMDLETLPTTAELAKNHAKEGAKIFVVFTRGLPQAPRMYEDAAALVHKLGLELCPIKLYERAIYRHGALQGLSVMEMEPQSKAAEEIQEFYTWIVRELT